MLGPNMSGAEFPRMLEERFLLVCRRRSQRKRNRDD
jgi:hypothetical protein